MPTPSSSRYLRRYRPCDFGDTRVDRVWCLKKESRSTRKRRHTPQEEFENKGISFEYVDDHTVLVKRSMAGDNIKISPGHVFNTVMRNVEYNVTVRNLIFDSEQEFHQLKVDLEAPKDTLGKIFENANVFNVHLYHRISHFDRRELENTVQFWENLKTGSLPPIKPTTPPPKTPTPPPNTSPPPKTPTPPPNTSPPPTSPLPEDGFNFEFKNSQKIVLTNSHGISFEINGGTYFRSEVTIDNGQLKRNTKLKEKKQFSMSPSHRRETGIIEGYFEKFNEGVDAEIVVESYLNSKDIGQLVTNVDFVSNLEFWQNLEIITHRKSFPKNGKFVQSSNNNTKLTIYDEDDEHYINILKGEKFETVIFRPDNWLGWAQHRIKFNFLKTMGTEMKITGEFKSFDAGEVNISINFVSSEKLLMGLVAVAVVGTLLNQVVNMNTFQNNTKTGLVPYGAEGETETVTNGTSVRSGGGVLNYKVPYDPSLPFWENMTVTKSYCKVADAKSKKDVNAVKNAASPLRSILKKGVRFAT